MREKFIVFLIIIAIVFAIISCQSDEKKTENDKKVDHDCSLVINEPKTRIARRS